MTGAVAVRLRGAVNVLSWWCCAPGVRPCWFPCRVAGAGGKQGAGGAAGLYNLRCTGFDYQGCALCSMPVLLDGARLQGLCCTHCVWCRKNECFQRVKLISPLIPYGACEVPMIRATSTHKVAQLPDIQTTQQISRCVVAAPLPVRLLSPGPQTNGGP